MQLVVGRDDLAAAALAAAEAAGVELDRLAVSPVHKAAGGFVNDATVDVCEVPVVTLLQAVAYGRPVALLPVATLVRAQHQTLVTMRELTVADIEGSSVGVRSWSQTTGVWLRGFLSEQFGVDLRKVDWTVYESGHVDAYQDPGWVRRAAAGARLPADFLDGRLDFGIMGNELPPDDRIHPVIPNARDVAAEWAAAKGFTPVNHVVGVTVAAAGEHSAAICSVYDALAEDSGLAGFAALRGPIAQAAAYALEQELLARPVDFDELVDRSCAALGVSASRLGG